MSQYFFHLRGSGDDVIDPEGSEMTQEAMRKATMVAARDCMAGDVHEGRLDLGYRIDVETDAGQIVHSLRFGDAVRIIPEAST